MNGTKKEKGKKEQIDVRIVLNQSVSIIFFLFVCVRFAAVLVLMPNINKNQNTKNKYTTLVNKEQWHCLR